MGSQAIGQIKVAFEVPGQAAALLFPVAPPETSFGAGGAGDEPDRSDRQREGLLVALPIAARGDHPGDHQLPRAGAQVVPQTAAMFSAVVSTVDFPVP